VDVNASKDAKLGNLLLKGRLPPPSSALKIHAQGTQYYSIRAGLISSTLTGEIGRAP